MFVRQRDSMAKIVVDVCINVIIAQQREEAKFNCN